MGVASPTRKLTEPVGLRVIQHPELVTSHTARTTMERPTDANILEHLYNSGFSDMEISFSESGGQAVYGKRVHPNYTVRAYSGVRLNKRHRSKHNPLVLRLFWADPQNGRSIQRVGREVRVQRVPAAWRSVLPVYTSPGAWRRLLITECDECGAPMRRLTTENGPFLGCARFGSEGCTNTINLVN